MHPLKIKGKNMDQKEYLKQINDLSKYLVSPTESLKKRILNNSNSTIAEPINKNNNIHSILTLFALVLATVLFLNSKGNLTDTKSFVVNQNYIANFDLNDLKSNEMAYIEIELPDHLNLVSKKLQNKKKFIFVWSIFSETKIVSFPFNADKSGLYNLKINILNESMNIIDIKSMKVKISKG